MSLGAEKEVQLVHKEQYTQAGEVQHMVQQMALQTARTKCPLKDAGMVAA